VKAVTDTRLLFQRYTLQMLRNPTWLFVGFSTPLLYLVLFTPLLRHLAIGGHASSQVLDVFLPGILALLAFASGISGGFSTIFELQDGVIESFPVAAARRSAIFMGPIFSRLLLIICFRPLFLPPPGPLPS